jgi:hypothetical protein
MRSEQRQSVMDTIHFTSANDQRIYKVEDGKVSTARCIRGSPAGIKGPDDMRTRGKPVRHKRKEPGDREGGQVRTVEHPVRSLLRYGSRGRSGE